MRASLFCIGVIFADFVSARPRGFGGRKPRQPHEPMTMYLPEFVGGNRTLGETADAGVFLIENKNLSSSTPWGLGYHYGPTQGQKSSTMLVAWGSKVNGTLSDGFLRVPDVGRQFEHSIVARGLKRFFKSVDLDKDGGLTLAELANFSHEAESQQLQRKAKKLSRRMDKNYDRKVSVEEVCQANKVKLAVNNTEENVKVADVDGDGFLSKDEFLSLLSPRNDDAQTTLNQIVSATDENKDGNITLAEWTKAWDILDADEANERLSSWKDRMSMHAELMEANAESSQQEDSRGDARAPRGARGGRMEDMDSPRGGKGRGPRNDERVPRGGRSSGRGGGQKKNSA